MSRLHYDTYEEIKIKVANLLEQYNIHSIPIDCVKLAQDMGFELKPYSKLSAKKLKALKELSDGDGYTIDNVDTGQKILFYDDSVCIGRQRFTILHEIGHYVLGHREESELAESEADFFAKYAIAPMPIIYALDIDDYVDISEKFLTSSECAFYIMVSYVKWLQYGPKYFTEYEKQLLTLFNVGDFKL